MQGFNMGRYVPPEHEGVISGNALQKKHPLGARARKPGVLVVRFEMPFPIWCATCPQPTVIGQGVRFNAEKKKTGSYYTTPVYSFTLKHAACGGIIVIQTDPKNTEYEIISGARRRDLGSAEDSIIKTPREQAETRHTAISLLEKTIADREKLVDSSLRIEELQDAADRHWDDPYAHNQRLRKAFRAGRHEREKQSAIAQDLQDRMSLGIPLLPSTEEDARRAALIEFGGIDQDEMVRKSLAKPLFGATAAATASTTTTTTNLNKEKPPPNSRGGLGGGGNKKMLKSEIAAQKIKQSLVSEIVGNTRAAMDPFLGFGNNTHTTSGPKAGGLLPGLKKRKRAPDDEEVRDATVLATETLPVAASSSSMTATAAGGGGGGGCALVNYNSDSD